MTKQFVPESFVVPESLITKHYRLEILSPRVTELDYEAVMSSRLRLRSIFAAQTPWPKDDMSLENNTADLARHEREFKAREAFAYTVLTLSGDTCIGCVYIEPASVALFDCEVYLWVRDSHIALDEDLYQTTHSWLKTHWPFEQITFPGRSISWEQWKSYTD